MSADTHAKQGLRDTIEAIREAIVAGDAWRAANPDFVIPDSPEWARWQLAQDRLRDMVAEFDLSDIPHPAA